MFTTEANTSILSDHYPLVSATFLNLAVVMIYWRSDCSITLVKYSFETICPDNVNLNKSHTWLKDTIKKNLQDKSCR